MAIPMFLHLVNPPQSDPVLPVTHAALIRQVDALLERQEPQNACGTLSWTTRRAIRAVAQRASSPAYLLAYAM